MFRLHHRTAVFSVFSKFVRGGATSDAHQDEDEQKKVAIPTKCNHNNLPPHKVFRVGMAGLVTHRLATADTGSVSLLGLTSGRLVYSSPGLNQRLAFRRVTTVPYRFRYARPTARTV
jgi:hypothetical protein